MKNLKSVNISDILDGYVRNKSIRALSREYGLERGKIRQILSAHGVRILTNDEAIQHANLKYPKVPFSGKAKDKAYLYGFVLGDVHVFKRSKFTLRAITHTTRQCFVDLFLDVFSPYGKVNLRVTKNENERGLWADLDYASFCFLDRNKAKLPTWINESNFLHFLSGLIDSDGSVLLRKAGKYFQYVVKIFGEDKLLLNEIDNRFRKLGFRPSFNRMSKKGETRIWKDRVIKYNKDYFALEIYRKEDTIKLLKLLDLRHKEKIVRKKQALDIYQRKLTRWEDVKGEITKLRKLIAEEAEELWSTH